jgi:prophage antirepressor-like protein
MNELARLVDFFFEFTRKYRIVDRAGNLWFVVKDIYLILGIKNPSQAVENFPNDWKFTISLTYSEGHRKRAHKVLKKGKIRVIGREGNVTFVERDRRLV